MASAAPASSAITYDRRGAGRPLVLLHGHPFDRSMWRPQLEALSADFCVMAPDLPGYGESPPGADPMSMRALADAVIGLLDRLEIERSIVVGLSMGGLVAMEVGLGYPSRVDGLVLAATTAEPATADDTATRLAKAALAEERGMLPLAGDMIATLFGPIAGRDHDLVLRMFTMMLAAPPEGAAAALRGRAQRPDYTRLLPGLTVPAVVLAGAYDVHSPEPVVQQLLGALPDAELVRFAGSGHLPNLEEPDRFNDAVRSFAARLR